MKPVYELLAADLKRLGVEMTFGLMSDDICQFVAALDASGVRFVGARHENSAIMMAVGYANTTGKLGVCVIGRGPATANGMLGLVGAARSNRPILIITGEAPVDPRTPDMIGPDGKAYPGEAILRLGGLSTFSPKHGHVARQMLQDAVGEAMLNKAAVLMVPVDVLLAEIDPAEEGEPTPVSFPRRIPKARQQAIDSAAALIAKSRKPIIVAGQGAYYSGAKAAIEKLAEKSGALLANALKGKDMFRGHPHNIGIIGSSSHSVARRRVEQADCIIAIGASLNRFTMSAGESFPAVPLIHIDVSRANIGRYWYADLAIVGDAKEVTERLVEAIPDRAPAEKPFHSNAIRDEIASFDHLMDFKPENTARTLDVRIAALEFEKVLPENRQLVFDGGNFMFAWGYMSVPSPNHFMHTQDSGSIGLGMGLAIGAALSQPDRHTVAFIGDGGFLMSLGELETIIREEVPITLVVMNDAAYGAEVHFLRASGHSPSTARFPDADFAPLAETLGFQSATVRTVEDIRKLAPLLKEPDGPILIDCKINGDVVAPFIQEVTYRKT